MYNLSISVNDTTALSDSTVIKLIKLMEPSLPCVHEVPSNCQDVTIVALVCGAIVLTTLIVAVSLLFYFCRRNSKLRKQQDAERIREKEERWFSLRKEYQSAILSILEPKETTIQKEESSEEKGNNTEELNCDSEEKGNETPTPNDVVSEIRNDNQELQDNSKEAYIKELRDCIKWIDEQMSNL